MRLCLPLPHPPSHDPGASMSAVACYFRLTVPTDPGGKLAAAMTKSLEKYTRSWLPTANWRGAFAEEASTRRLRFGQRPLGSRVQLSLDTGDHLVIAEAAPAFKDWSDFLETTRLWESLGIFIHFIAPPADSMTPDGRAALELLKQFAQAERGRRAERTREGNATRRLAGRATNGSPPYGYRLVGQKGFRRRIVDQYTREVGRLIVQWKLAGHSWESIYFHLIRHDVLTRDGREFSLGAIRRAFAGECRLQAEEEEGVRKL
jgi:hypothetical protein